MKIEEFLNSIEQLNINLNNNQINQLNEFYKLLKEWNQKINLTRITEEDEVYLKHFYDSLTLNKVIDLKKIETLCDFGTGAGFPGIVLKICFPNIKVTLIDSLQKRINYLNDVIEKLKLENIETYHMRGEDFSKLNREKYDVVTARAVSNLNIISEICIPMVKVNGYFIPMKGNCEEEIKESLVLLKKLDCSIEKIENFDLPIENSRRTLIKIKKEKETNKKYPRTIEKMKKFSL